MQVQHYHVTVTLLLTLADALRKASAPQPAAAGATAEEQAQQAAVLAGGAASLTSAVLHRRLKALYFCLSSDVHGKANAALTLLEAVAATCGAPLATSSCMTGRAASGGTVGSSPVSLRDFVRAFDWSLSALPGLAKPPRCIPPPPCCCCCCCCCPLPLLQAENQQVAACAHVRSLCGASLLLPVLLPYLLTPDGYLAGASLHML
jgi:hypothetical protein